MARLMGVELPNNKRVEVALTYIYGIGPTTASKILKETNIDPNLRVKDLSEDHINRLTVVIQRGYKVEGELRREEQANIKRLIEIGCYRGIRHKRGLPVRGQRTHTNARTRKGPRKTVGVIRSKEKRSALKASLLSGAKKEKK